MRECDLSSDRPADQRLRQWRFRAPPGACDLLLVRHGESQALGPDDVVARLDGRADPPLDAVGRREAEAVAGRLTGAGIHAIVTSGMARTIETAAPLAARLGLEPAVEPDLREVFLGDWDGGEYRRRVASGDPLVREVFRRGDWGVIPNAEPMEEFSQRVRGALERIAGRHPDRRVAVVAHGGVIGAALAMAAGSAPFAFVGAANASISHLVLTEERWIVRRYNDTAHLDTDLDAPA